MADREASSRYLLRFHESEEIGLIFIGVGSFENHGPRRAIFESSIVAGRDGVEAVGQGIVEKNSEFDLAIAHDIRVWCNPGFVAIEQVIDDPLAVVFHQVHHAERDVEGIGYCLGVLDILLPGTVAEDIVLVDPILHVSAFNGIALLFEQESGDAAINAA